MNLAPLAIQKFFGNDGRPLSGGLLFTYAAGTTTKIATYTDVSGASPNTNPVVLDFRGECRLWIDPTLNYKFVLAPANDTDPPTAPIWTVDNIAGGVAFYPRTPAEIVAGVTPTSYLYPELNVFRYMTTAQVTDVTARTLALDTRAALQTAVSVAQVYGGCIYCPRGSYLVRRVAGLDAQFNGIWIPYTNVFGYNAHIKLIGDGRATVFCAGDNSMTVIRWSDSDGIGRDFAIDGNGKTAVTGISLISSNTASATIAENIDHNKFWIDVRNCAEGVELECPSLGGCYYNVFNEGIWQDNTRHIRLRDNAVAKAANRNTFKQHMVGGNCGLYIDGADTTMAIAATFEGIGTGVTPLAVPTAVYINSVGSLSGANTADTNLIDCNFESNTRDLDCNNARTSILGGTCGNQASGGIFGAVAGTSTPDVWMGGDRTYQARELLIGGPGADSLLLNNRIAAYLAANPQVCTSANVAGTFPFDNDGSILIQARQQVASGCQLAVGAASLQGLDLLGDGSIAARANSRIVLRIGTAAYSASITLDTTTGNLFEIVANNGVAFTINVPTNPKTGQQITIVIFNTSGGALGAVTWNAIFKMSAWTQPANGNNRAITFYYGGTQWRQMSQTGVDVPN